ncbi:KIR protein [Plasmodium coatneyi]|uniref:KIR protein n=1 Tax=Plasmodium coatneyi TaxID=208452 RepID=A0A1B1DXB1_9APIC|nr:KIR protein [Plasmodium coatneyi]ANQ07394.1 KIR protein [Plasmodium coatneyi]
MDGSKGNKELRCNNWLTLLGSYGNQIKQKLEEVTQEKSLEDDISSVWCCLSNIYNSNTDKHGPCDLLYYVVGSIVHKKLVDKTLFDRIMEKIYEILKLQLKTSQCNLRNKESGKKLFDLMEKWSSYNLDPTELWEDRGNSRKVSCKKCANYLEKVAEACKEVIKQCRKSPSSEGCGGITDKDNQGSPEYLLQLIEPIISKPQATAMAEAGRVQPVLQQQGCLDQLPSVEHFYSKFGKTAYPCNDTSFKGIMESALTSYSDLSGYADYIVGPWCYVHNGMERTNPLYGARCNLLYYLIGYLLLDNLSEDEFSNRMNTIYNTLQNFRVQNQCEHIRTENIDKKLLKQMRAVHTYYQDYSTIEQRLNTSDKSCNEAYYTHLRGVPAAYTTVREWCRRKPNEKYCQNFEQKYEKYGGSVLSNLMCSLNHTPDCPSNNIPAAIFGTIATVGLPTITFFFLYKYILLPSWLHNHVRNIYFLLLDILLQHHPIEEEQIIEKDINNNSNDEKRILDYYNEFNGQLDVCQYLSNDNFEDKIDQKLHENFKNGPYDSKIVQAWCCASRKKEQNKSSDNDAPCHFFYYWLGEKVLAKRGKNPWADTVKAIYNELKGPPGKETCGIIYQAIREEEFTKKKEAYEYLWNYGTIQTHMEGKESCDTQCDEYLKETFSAYKKVFGECIGENGATDPYCTEFKRKHDGPLGDLPSKQIYKKFGKSNEYCGYHSQATEIMKQDRHIENKLGITKDNAEQIMKTLCCAKGEKGSSLSVDDYCHALYYWIGNTFFSTQKHFAKFSECVGVMYELLKEQEVGHLCAEVYYKISKKLFHHRKAIFDYSHDYKTLKEELLSGRLLSNGKYREHVQNIILAYYEVNEDCMSKGAEDSYCKKFREEYMEYGETKLSELLCLAEGKQNCEAPMEHEPGARQPKSSTIPFHGNITNNIPHRLRCSRTKLNLDMYKNDLKSKLGELREDANLVDDILSLWCCLSDTYEWNTDKHGRCDLLYYVVGSIIYKKLGKEDSFDGIMSAVYTYLGSMLSAGKCKDVPSTKGKELFKLMGEQSFYNLSPKEIWKQQENSGRISCGRCTNYLGKLAEACKKAEAQCRHSPNSDDCDKVSKGNDQGSPEYVSQLIYSIIPEPRTTSELDGRSESQTGSLQSEGANIQEQITINNTSYTFLGIATPLITFFFYKYISLFPFRRRNSSKGSSRRRGRFVSHNSDTETENFTNYSTDYSTENSIVNSTYESTDVSTVEDSTEYYSLYNSNPKRTSNNGRRNGQPQPRRGRAHNGNRQRTNIGYQNM